MPKRRIRLPDQLAEEVLFRANHTCCICLQAGKDVQIHHIDEDPSNNIAENLAVLCLDDHSKVTGTPGLGRKYTTAEVRRYKVTWERKMSAARDVRRRTVRVPPAFAERIDWVICEILVCGRDTTEAKRLLAALMELRLWRCDPAIDRRMLEGFEHLAEMAGLNSAPLASLVADALEQMVLHLLAGPGLLPMTRSDEEQFRHVIKVLDALARLTCGYNRRRSAISSIVLRTEQFLDRAIAYKRPVLVNALVAVYRNALHECSFAGKLEFPVGRQVLLGSLRRAGRLLRGGGKRWTVQTTTVDRLLAEHSAGERRSKNGLSGSLSRAKS